MSGWVEQYLDALRARDEKEKAAIDVYRQCTKLQDQWAQAQQTQRRRVAEDIPQQANPPPPSIMGRGLRRVTSPPLPTASESANLAQLRQDLAKSQQERGEMSTKLEVALRELDTLRGKARVDVKRINQLNTQVTQLAVKLKDREEELRGKAKLIENVQDENVTLNLQLNMADEQAEKLKSENKELVDRWMARMGKEADQMNEQHKFG
ncbi:hypothetical protein PV10_04182 [Exophiala mesophila]|uniref:Autophagy-related protein 16 domain-containing protein n=1 Tax=Exophiala mesophila TaxID=212818 RepID=A0A0D1XXH0_EXOME|nr:uncharacterized protein PV10_04182 [Exophiala mesophila]KIV92926.1 hypothetical protein PV10_04182 [Exophiala mesophila]